MAVTFLSCGARSELDESGQGGAGVDAAPDACREVEAHAALAPLDVFLVLDSSGSMAAPTLAGPSKWSELGGALERFFDAPESAGIGISLSFFPVEDASIPELCVAGDECRTPDGCRRLGICTSFLEICEEDGDCATTGVPGDACERVGLCAGQRNVPCALERDGAPCGTSPCLAAGFCLDRYSCDERDYLPPGDAMHVLPAGARSLSGRVETRVLRGATPTLPAVRGAIGAARAWATANPSHKVVLVLATDGLPTVCGSADYSVRSVRPAVIEIAAAVSIGRDAGIQSFVVGVFSPDDISTPRENLDRIASAGGTRSAFLVTTDEHVSERLLAAFSEVRARAKSCEFALPKLPAFVDYARLRVRLAGAEEPEFRVSSADCDEVWGGFHYEVPPAPDTAPTRVILCPASCGVLVPGVQRTVRVAAGCDG